MSDILFIHKEAGAKKDAVRVNSEADIPEFLKGAVKVNGNKLELECVEGNETANLGAVIGYEKLERTSSGYNCWVIGNAKTNLIENVRQYRKEINNMLNGCFNKELQRAYYQTLGATPEEFEVVYLKAINNFEILESYL